MTKTTFDPAPFLTDSHTTGINNVWYHYRFPNGETASVSLDLNRPFHWHMCGDAFEYGAQPGMTTEQVLAALERIAAEPADAATVAPIQLDEDGYPYDRYADDVCDALQKLGIRAHTPHYEGPWERQVMLPATGGYAGCFAVWLCWMADQSDPSRGEGWFIADDADEDSQTRVTKLSLPHYASPDEVAAEVAGYLLDEGQADAQATASHGYTTHGHQCCPQASADLRPPLVARCGGAGLCTACREDAAAIHNAATAADATVDQQPTDGAHCSGCDTTDDDYDPALCVHCSCCCRCLGCEYRPRDGMLLGPVEIPADEGQATPTAPQPDDQAEQQALIQMVIDALPPAADETLWAVHIQGSDDIVPQPTREAADKVKAQLDAYDESNAHRKDFPKASAVVVEWPYAREEHARHLADEAASTDAF